MLETIQKAENGCVCVYLYVYPFYQRVSCYSKDKNTAHFTKLQNNYNNCTTYTNFWQKMTMSCGPIRDLAYFKLP